MISFSFSSVPPQVSFISPINGSGTGAYFHFKVDSSPEQFPRSAYLAISPSADDFREACYIVSGT
jgi:hypothetical protein